MSRCWYVARPASHGHGHPADQPPRAAAAARRTATAHRISDVPTSSPPDAPASRSGNRRARSPWPQAPPPPLAAQRSGADAQTQMCLCGLPYARGARVLCLLRPPGGPAGRARRAAHVRARAVRPRRARALRVSCPALPCEEQGGRARGAGSLCAVRTAHASAGRSERRATALYPHPPPHKDPGGARCLAPSVSNGCVADCTRIRFTDTHNHGLPPPPIDGSAGCVRREPRAIGARGDLRSHICPRARLKAVFWWVLSLVPSAH